MNAGVPQFSYSLNLSFNDNASTTNSSTENSLHYVKIHKDNTVQTNSVCPSDLVSTAVPRALHQVLTHYGVEADKQNSIDYQSVQDLSSNTQKEVSFDANYIKFSTFLRIKEDSILNSTAWPNIAVKEQKKKIWKTDDWNHVPISSNINNNVKINRKKRQQLEHNGSQEESRPHKYLISHIQGCYEDISQTVQEKKLEGLSVCNVKEEFSKIVKTAVDPIEDGEKTVQPKHLESKCNRKHEPSISLNRKNNGKMNRKKRRQLKRKALHEESRPHKYFISDIHGCYDDVSQTAQEKKFEEVSMICVKEDFSKIVKTDVDPIGNEENHLESKCDELFSDNINKTIAIRQDPKKSVDKRGIVSPIANEYIHDNSNKLVKIPKYSLDVDEMNNVDSKECKKRALISYFDQEARDEVNQMKNIEARGNKNLESNDILCDQVLRLASYDENEELANRQDTSQKIEERQKGKLFQPVTEHVKEMERLKSDDDIDDVSSRSIADFDIEVDAKSMVENIKNQEIARSIEGRCDETSKLSGRVEIKMHSLLEYKLEKWTNPESEQKNSEEIKDGDLIKEQTNLKSTNAISSNVSSDIIDKVRLKGQSASGFIDEKNKIANKVKQKYEIIEIENEGENSNLTDKVGSENIVTSVSESSLQKQGESNIIISEDAFKKKFIDETASSNDCFENVDGEINKGGIENNEKEENCETKSDDFTLVQQSTEYIKKKEKESEETEAEMQIMKKEDLGILDRSDQKRDGNIKDITSETASVNEEDSMKNFRKEFNEKETVNESLDQAKAKNLNLTEPTVDNDKESMISNEKQILETVTNDWFICQDSEIKNENGLPCRTILKNKGEGGRCEEKIGNQLFIGREELIQRILIEKMIDVMKSPETNMIQHRNKYSKDSMPDTKVPTIPDHDNLDININIWEKKAKYKKLYNIDNECVPDNSNCEFITHSQKLLQDHQCTSNIMLMDTEMGRKTSRKKKKKESLCKHEFDEVTLVQMAQSNAICHEIEKQKEKNELDNSEEGKEMAKSIGKMLLPGNSKENISSEENPKIGTGGDQILFIETKTKGILSDVKNVSPKEDLHHLNENISSDIDYNKKKIRTQKEKKKSTEKDQLEKKKLILYKNELKGKKKNESKIVSIENNDKDSVNKNPRKSKSKVRLNDQISNILAEKYEALFGASESRNKFDDTDKKNRNVTTRKKRGAIKSKDIKIENVFENEKNETIILHLKTDSKSHSNVSSVQVEDCDDWETDYEEDPELEYKKMQACVMFQEKHTSRDSVEQFGSVNAIVEMNSAPSSTESKIDILSGENDINLQVLKENPELEYKKTNLHEKTVSKDSNEGCDNFNEVIKSKSSKSTPSIPSNDEMVLRSLKQKEVEVNSTGRNIFLHSHSTQNRNSKTHVTSFNNNMDIEFSEEDPEFKNRDVKLNSANSDPQICSVSKPNKEIEFVTDNDDMDIESVNESIILERKTIPPYVKSPQKETSENLYQKFQSTNKTVKSNPTQCSSSTIKQIKVNNIRLDRNNKNMESLSYDSGMENKKIQSSILPSQERADLKPSQSNGFEDFKEELEKKNSPLKTSHQSTCEMNARSHERIILTDEIFMDEPNDSTSHTIIADMKGLTKTSKEIVRNTRHRQTCIEKFITNDFRPKTEINLNDSESNSEVENNFDVDTNIKAQYINKFIGQSKLIVDIESEQDNFENTDTGKAQVRAEKRTSEIKTVTENLMEGTSQKTSKNEVQNKLTKIRQGKPIEKKKIQSKSSDHIQNKRKKKQKTKNITEQVERKESLHNEENVPEIESIITYFKRKNGSRGAYQRHSLPNNKIDMEETNSNERNNPLIMVNGGISKTELNEQLDVSENLNSEVETKVNDSYTFADILSQNQTNRLDKEFEIILDESSRNGAHGETNSEDDDLSSNNTSDSDDTPKPPKRKRVICRESGKFNSEEKISKKQKKKLIKIIRGSKTIWEIHEKIHIQNKNEVEKKIHDLVIQNPYPLSRIHKIATYPIKAPSKEQRQALKEKGIEMKLGYFSEQEDHQIRKNWKEFCELHNWDENDYLPFVTSSKRSKYGVLSSEQTVSFVQFLSHGFLNRTMDSVYRRFRKIFAGKEQTNGRFSKEDDKIILEYIKTIKSGTPYEDIATILKRSKESILKRYQILRVTNDQQRPKFRWTKELGEKLLVHLIEVTYSINLLELKNRTITSQEWLQVAERMKLPASTIKKSWFLNFYPRFFTPNYFENSAHINRKLIDIVSSKYSDWKNIDWNTVESELGCDFPAMKCCKTLYDLVRNKVPSDIGSNMKDALTFLKGADLSLTEDRFSFVKDILEETKNGTIMPMIE